MAFIFSFSLQTKYLNNNIFFVDLYQYLYLDNTSILQLVWNSPGFSQIS
jgi:hypothetical protein